MNQPLQAELISVSFDGLHALSNVNLDIPPAKISGLIGPNGAGKTTLVNVFTGFQVPSSGHVHFEGRDVSRLSSHKLRRLGIARTFQGGRLFRDLTVLDNVEVTGVGLGLRRREAAAMAIEMLEWAGIDHLAGQLADGLPYTDQRRVGIARSLMMQPRFLLLDEPAAGMSKYEADGLSRLIHRIISELGCGVLLIEHNISLVLQVCEHIHVLDSGEMIDEGNPDHIKSSDKVLHAYLGTQADVAAHEGALM